MNPVKHLVFSLFTLWITGMIVFFASCTKNDPAFAAKNIPADSVIPRDQMIRMLTEIHILEAGLQQEKKRENDQVKAAFYYTRFFSGYKMSEKRFKNNLEVYQSDTDEFLKLYEEVIRDLEKRSELLKSPPPVRK